MKYKCMLCGYIYDDEKEEIKFADLPDDWTCPLCGVGKDMFELVEDEVENKKEDDDLFPNAVKISQNNVSIERINSNCINCGLCVSTCTKKEGMTFDKDSELCVNCGQCIQTCPVNALIPKDNRKELYEALEGNKVTIAYTSPAVRVSFAECFGMEVGTFSQRKLIGFLRMLGFKYVFDTTFAADLTIMEEANELVNRVKNNGKLPMFTSCCPAWIKYAEQFYPDILDNISSCKSPIGMMGKVVKEYFCKSNNIDNSYTVAITPCTAKKFEIAREEINGTDLVITVSELAKIIKEKNIKYEDIPESDYDSVLGEGSGAGIIFGNTGGVMEAALRTAYHMITKENLDTVVFNDVRGYENFKEATIHIGDITLNVAVVHGITNVKNIIEDIRNNTCKYHFIEVMNCEGGCIGGGGQPKVFLEDEKMLKEKRIKNLYERDNNSKIRCSHDNPDIISIYEKYFKGVGSPLAKDLLHTKYIKR